MFVYGDTRSTNKKEITLAVISFFVVELSKLALSQDRFEPEATKLSEAESECSHSSERAQIAPRAQISDLHRRIAPPSKRASSQGV